MDEIEPKENESIKVQTNLTGYHRWVFEKYYEFHKGSRSEVLSIIIKEWIEARREYLKTLKISEEKYLG